MTVAKSGSHRSHSLGRPSFVGPCGARVEESILTARAFGGTACQRRVDGLDWKLRLGDGNADALEDPEVDFDDVPCLSGIVEAASSWIVDLGVEEPRGGFASIAGGKPDDAGGTRASRQQGRLDQALQIDGYVIAVSPELFDGCQECCASGAFAAIVDDQSPIDYGNEVEDLAMLGADQPVDPRRGTGAADGRGNGDRVDNVPESAKANDQSPSHDRLLRAEGSERVGSALSPAVIGDGGHVRAGRAWRGSWRR